MHMTLNTRYITNVLDLELLSFVPASYTIRSISIA